MQAVYAHIRAYVVLPVRTMTFWVTIRHYYYLAALLLAATAITPTTKAYSDNRQMRDKLLQVGDTVVKSIMPKPTTDSLYVATDYTEIHFRLNSAELDISYMENGLSLLNFDRVIDSIGIENIRAIEIVSQSSPEGTLQRNTWLTDNRSKAMSNYIQRVFPELKSRLTMNKVIESWQNLALYVAQDPNLEEETIEKILDIIESEQMSVATKKAKLKTTLGSNPKTGDVYKYLTTYYYPVIRNSGIYILHMLEPEPEFWKEAEGISVQEETVSIDSLLTPIEPVSPSIVKFHKRPLLSVKTNMAYNAFFTPDMGWAPIYNIEAELYPTEQGRWSWLLEYEFPWHSNINKHQYLQILNLQFEGRRYFKRSSNHTGHYLSAYLGANLYDICFDKKVGHGYQGEGFGGGLGYGYVMPLGKKPDSRWKMEFFLKGGYYATYYDPYDAGTPFAGKYYYEWYDNPKLFKKRNYIFRWFGPTGVGITVSYDLIRKKTEIKQ